MHQLAYRAYGQTTRQTADPRQIEKTLFEQVTDALVHVNQSGGADAALWADAVHRNSQLWLTLAGDLLTPENALPSELKTGLLNLAEFVRRTSLAVLAGREGMDDLIAINQAVLGGLEAQSAAMALQQAG